MFQNFIKLCLSIINWKNFNNWFSFVNSVCLQPNSHSVWSNFKSVQLGYEEKHILHSVWSNFKSVQLGYLEKHISHSVWSNFKSVQLGYEEKHIFFDLHCLLF